MAECPRWWPGLEAGGLELAAGAMLVLVGCGGELPPVENTRPSQDPRILNAPATMSDGPPIPAHVTETVTSSMELVSHGSTEWSWPPGPTGL